MITKGVIMAVYKLYHNKKTDVFEIHDNACEKKQLDESFVLVDKIETDMTIKEAFQRYFLTYPQRHVVIADCCKRKK